MHKSLIRDLKAQCLRLKHRQQSPVSIPPMDETPHFCGHCYYAYNGRLCPQCGTPATRQRLTGRQLMTDTLETWGMGSRPILRTMGHLIWRPGYMIRDYLNGHYLSYFPPFKLLTILLAVLLLAVWMFQLPTEPMSPTHLGAFSKAWDLIAPHTLCRLLLQDIFFILAVWIVFRREGLNITETFYALVYINCQMLMLTAVWLLLAQRLHPIGFLPFAIPDALAALFLLYDFKQLYGLSLGNALWRTLLIILLLLVIYMAAALCAVLVTNTV